MVRTIQKPITINHPNTEHVRYSSPRCNHLFKSRYITCWQIILFEFLMFQAINEKLDMSEKKLIEFASMPDIEEQLRDRMEALTQAQERQGPAEDRIQRLECQLEEKTADVFKLSQRLKMNEEHNQRLSATVDKLLSGKKLFINYVTQIGRGGGWKKCYARAYG